MNTYTLTPEEKAAYHDDAVRSQIRSAVAGSYLTTETVQIVDEGGALFDQVNGSRPTDETVELAKLADSYEELAADVEAEAARLAELIRPRAMNQLRREAKKEMREKLQESANEVLKLRADLARAKLEHAAEVNRLKAQLVLVKARANRQQAVTDAPASKAVES